MKRLIAFSSVAHMGFVMLGISTLTPLGINAALFGMVAHGLITGMLFFVAGSVKERYHTLEIKRLSGMLKQMPHLGWILGFCSMASLGLPGLAGFWGEFPAILSSWSPASVLVDNGHQSLFRVLTVIAALGTVLAAGYLLWLYQRTAFGEPTAEFAIADGGHGHGHGDDAHGDDHHSDIHDVSTFEWISWTPLLIAILVFGVVPSLMFKVMDPAVQQLTSIFGK
jgi:NADH-quinone oxidoreductase subunit M